MRSVVRLHVCPPEGNEMTREELITYLKENLKIVVSETGSDSYGYGGQYVDVSLMLEGEVISSDSFSVEKD